MPIIPFTHTPWKITNLDCQSSLGTTPRGQLPTSFDGEQKSPDQRYDTTRVGPCSRWYLLGSSSKTIQQPWISVASFMDVIEEAAELVSSVRCHCSLQFGKGCVRILCCKPSFHPHHLLTLTNSSKASPTMSTASGYEMGKLGSTDSVLSRRVIHNHRHPEDVQPSTEQGRSSFTHSNRPEVGSLPDCLQRAVKFTSEHCHTISSNMSCVNGIKMDRLGQFSF